MIINKFRRINMKKYNINGMPFYLPENLDEFKKNSNKIAKIYY